MNIPMNMSIIKCCDDGTPLPIYHINQPTNIPQIDNQIRVIGDWYRVQTIIFDYEMNEIQVFVIKI